MTISRPFFELQLRCVEIILLKIHDKNKCILPSSSYFYSYITNCIQKTTFIDLLTLKLVGMFKIKTIIWDFS